MDITCPQCNTLLESPLVRLVQDSCGHKKCRLCLLKDESQCQLCLKESQHKEPKHELNHTGVITCNKVNIKNTVKCIGDSDNVKVELNKNRDSIASEEKRSCKTIVLPNHIIRSLTNPPSYICNVCNKSFKTKSHIKYHSFCDGQKPLQCEKCNKRFVSKYHLEVHLLTHLSNKPYACDSCCKSFISLNKLNRHKLVHSESKQYVCQQCGKSFKNKDYLQRHIIIHATHKPFSCKICKAQFNNKSNLNKHQITHSKDKIHMCDECGKRFKFKNALTSHRLIHTKQRPYVCSVCSKTFINSKELHRHQLIHSDVKKYSCSLCAVSFVRKDNLQRHIRNSHPGKKAKPITKAIKENDKKETVSQVVIENPNAIKVITAPPVPSSSAKSEQNKQSSVVNAPVKLAFKTTAFKNHYNILSREYHIESTRMHSKYDYEESVNICKRILSPCSPPRTIIKTLGKVSEKESNEICHKILTPNVPPISADTYFDNQPSIIRNIKFKLPPKYLTLSKPNVLDEVLKPTIVSNKVVNNETEDNNTYAELKHVSLSNSATSVIVNTNSTLQNEIHWRRRLQNQEMSKENT